MARVKELPNIHTQVITDQYGDKPLATPVLPELHNNKHCSHKPSTVRIAATDNYCNPIKPPSCLICNQLILQYYYTALCPPTFMLIWFGPRYYLPQYNISMYNIYNIITLTF